MTAPVDAAVDVLVLDYGIGNLLNVVRALTHCGARVHVAADAGEAGALGMSPRHMVLPGVGAFADAMREIRARGFDTLVSQHVAAGLPFLGICVGMQVMFSVGEEFGEHAGLGIVPGRVVPISRQGTQGQALRIPLVGWRALHAPPGRDWQGTALRRLADGEQAYFVHSFTGRPDDRADVLAEVEYGGHMLCAAVRRGSALGCQFHPEKSAAAGLGILGAFLEQGA